MSGPCRGASRSSPSSGSESGQRDEQIDALTGSLRLALGDALWRGYFIEGYVFIALVYFFFSFIVSRYSQWLEVYLTGEKDRGHAAE